MGNNSRLRMTGLDVQQRTKRSLKSKKEATKKKAQQAKKFMELMISSLGLRDT